NEKSEVETLQDKFVFNAAELANYTGRLYRRRQELNMEYQQLGPAFTSTRWMDAGQRNRHIITRCTVHGFHFMICTRSHCYNITQDCSCKICGEVMISRLHILDCHRGGSSLAELVANISLSTYWFFL